MLLCTKCQVNKVVCHRNAALPGDQEVVVVEANGLISKSYLLLSVIWF